MKLIGTQAQENRHLRADATVQHTACTNEGGRAYRKKIQKYELVEFALQHYIHSGWSIEILPWVVDIRGFAVTKHLHADLEYLAISKSQWKVMIEHSVLASVRALA